MRIGLEFLLFLPLCGCIVVRPPDVTVIDPYAVPPVPPYGPGPAAGCPLQGAWLGAAQGAAGGALIGSLWGDAGRGAAVGAATGAVAGAVAAAGSCPP